MLLPALLVCTIIFVAGEFDNSGRIDNSFRRHYLKKIHLKSENENSKMSENNYTVCRTKGCFKVASDFLESMNESVNPCEDFYEYACGNWAKNNPIPPTEMTWDSMDKTSREVQYKIRDFLEEDIASDDILPVKQVKKFYKSCMNVDELEIRGLKPLEAILVRNGGWPLIMEPGEWYEDQFSWQQIDEYYSYLTNSALYSIEVNRDERKIESFGDLRKETSTVIELKIPQLPLVVTMSYGNDLNRTKMYNDGSYAKFIKDVASVFIEERGAHISEEKLNEEIEDMIEFEKKLGAERKQSEEDGIFGRIGSLENISISEKNPGVKNTLPINWNKIMTNLFDEVNIKLDGSEVYYVGVEMVAYLKKIVDILNETKPRTIVNYIHWNFLSQMLPYTTMKMGKLSFELKKHLTGIKTEESRWQMCVKKMIMKHAVSYHFVKKYFKDDMKEEGKKIFSSIQKEMTKQILKADWISNRLKKIHIEKIKNIRLVNGYPDWYDNATALMNYYRGIPIGHQYLDNILMFKTYSLKKRLRNLRNHVLDFEMYPTFVNAAYNQLYNQLTVPAGMFQFPFYSASQPETINFGELGTVMGHELAHGFDLIGLIFNKNENQIDWSREEEDEFEETASCFVSQYGKFHEIEDEFLLTIPGIMTVSENMADSVGVDIVYGALEEIEKEKNEPRLPGFEHLTNEQAFFLSFAKVWCTSSTPEYDELRRKYDRHSKPNYRVIATVQNSEGFAKAYNCPKGSPMNPEIKCKLW